MYSYSPTKILRWKTPDVDEEYRKLHVNTAGRLLMLGQSTMSGQPAVTSSGNVVFSSMYQNCIDPVSLRRGPDSLILNGVTYNYAGGTGPNEGPPGVQFYAGNAGWEYMELTGVATPIETKYHRRLTYLHHLNTSGTRYYWYNHFCMKSFLPDGIDHPTTIWNRAVVQWVCNEDTDEFEIYAPDSSQDWFYRWWDPSPPRPHYITEQGGNSNWNPGWTIGYSANIIDYSIWPDYPAGYGLDDKRKCNGDVPMPITSGECDDVACEFCAWGQEADGETWFKVPYGLCEPEIGVLWE